MAGTIEFRFATEQDVPEILAFIRALAEYENLLDSVVATEDVLRDWIFTKGRAEVLFARVDGRNVGFALFFYNFSTFLGRSGIYLEDLFVLRECRGQGYGKALLKELARLAVERDCGRLEWACLDWNTPSIRFYRSLGAQPLDDWTIFRVQEAALKALAEK